MIKKNQPVCSYCVTNFLSPQHLLVFPIAINTANKIHPVRSPTDSPRLLSATDPATQSQSQKRTSVTSFIPATRVMSRSLAPMRPSNSPPLDICTRQEVASFWKSIKKCPLVSCPPRPTQLDPGRASVEPFWVKTAPKLPKIVTAHAFGVQVVAGISRSGNSKPPIRYLPPGSEPRQCRSGVFFSVGENTPFSTSPSRQSSV